MTNFEAIHSIQKYQINPCSYCHEGGDEYDKWIKEKEREESMDGYEKIESELNLNDLACIEDILVTIKCGDTILNAILQPNDNFDGYIWDWDWWEGEQNVELIGAIAKADIRIYGNKLEYKENK